MIEIYYREGEKSKLVWFNFSMGEVHFKLNKKTNISKIVTIIESSDELIALYLLSQEIDASKVSLYLRYVPYGRQDRIINEYEPFSLKSICKLINLMGFGKVVIYDPHSSASELLIENSIVDNRELDVPHDYRDMVLVSPDIGAVKKNNKLAIDRGMDHVFSNKTRDKDGNVIGIELFDKKGVVRGRDCVVIDDICDGGKTFTEIYKVLKRNGAKDCHLWTSFGIYSKGEDVLSMFKTVVCKYKKGDIK